MSIIKIAIAGATGRMGQALIETCLASPNVELVGGGVREAAAAKGKEGVLLTSDIESLFQKADAMIDFTRPEHSLQIAAIAAKHGRIHICGTTGLDAKQIEALRSHGNKARIVYARNMSVGVNLLMGLVEQASAVLLAESFDIEIDEMHHKHKVDSPSGTALMLGEAAAKGRGVALESAKNTYGFGVTGERRKGSIGFSVRRGGDVVGDHSVVFAGPGERIELSHKASSRSIFASGAIRAALWARDKQPGFYTMRDVLAI